MEFGARPSSGAGISQCHQDRIRDPITHQAAEQNPGAVLAIFPDRKCGFEVVAHDGLLPIGEWSDKGNQRSRRSQRIFSLRAKVRLIPCLAQNGR